MPSPAYALRPDENINRGFVRVLGQIAVKGRGLTRKSTSRTVALIHEARTLIKRVRALLWLARPVFRLTAYMQAKTRLRSAARLLAVSRDLAVTQSILRKLARKASAPRDQKVLARMARIAGRSSPDGKKSQQDSLRKAVEILIRAIDEIKKSAAHANGPSPSDRLAGSLRATRRAGKKALRGGEDVSFHEWRKKAKRLLYHLEFISAEPDRRMVRTIKQVARLQDKLGVYHDCVVVQNHLRPYVPTSSVARRISDRLEKRKKQLRKKAQKIASRLTSK